MWSVGVWEAAQWLLRIHGLTRLLTFQINLGKPQQPRPATLSLLRVVVQKRSICICWSNFQSIHRIWTITFGFKNTFQS